METQHLPKAGIEEGLQLYPSASMRADESMTHVVIILALQNSVVVCVVSNNLTPYLGIAVVRPALNYT